MTKTQNSINTIIGQTYNSAFGELLVANVQPKVQLSFPYNLNSALVTTSVTGSGTATQSNSFAVLSTTATTSSSAKLVSRDYFHYRPGQGCSCLFTAVFTQGVAGSSQIIGLGNTVDGFFFGFNGSQFGILHRNNSVDTWIYQTSWNKDVMSGVQPSVMNLDPTKGNVYKIQFQWLGFGVINFYIEDYNSGNFELVHQIQYANSNTSTSLLNPSLQLYAESINTSNDTNVVLKSPSMCLLHEGYFSDVNLRNAVSSRKSSITSETNVLTIRNKSTFASKSNKSLVTPDFVTLSVAGSTDCRYSFYLNATLGGTPSYTDVSTNISVVDYDVAGTTVANGRALLYINVNGNEQQTISLSSLNLRLQPADTLTITGQSAGGGGAAITCDAGLSWSELI